MQFRYLAIIAVVPTLFAQSRADQDGCAVVTFALP
jgi:hypothetical protein